MNLPGTAAAVAVIMVALAVFALLPSLSSSRLTVVEQLINWHYSTPSISASELQSLLKSPAPLLIFDVRTAEEYAVSHLPHAINVSPKLATADFMQRFSQKSEGKRFVFYCSVGQRSSALADRVAKALDRPDNELQIVNLRGGIFRWAGDGLPMENQYGQTSVIHPYNVLAAKLLPPEVHKITTVGQ